jgi:hypothetical protein
MILEADPNISRQFKDIPLEDIRSNIGGDILSYVEDYMEDLGVVNHSKIMPLYFASLGAHILNMLNTGCAVDANSYCEHYGNLALGCGRYGRESKSPYFLTKFNMHQDLRAHIMYVAPSGYSKNFFMDMFMDKKYGFLEGTALPYRKPKSLTEPAYTGTLGMKREIIYGMGKQYCSGILGITEFSSITNMEKTEHSSNLLNYLLEGLETGEIDKFLGQGNIHYYTYHTLWAATQPGYRFDMNSGMGRRLNFHLFIPTKEEEQQYQNAQEKGYLVHPNDTVITQVRGYIYKLWHTVSVTGVKFSQEYNDWKTHHAVVRHTDYNLYDNIAMGYNFVVNYIPQYSGAIGQLTVKLDSRLKAMLEDLAQSRKMLMSESLVEWEMFLHELGHEPVSMYTIIRKVQEKQLLSWGEAMSRMKMALDEGIFGQFKIRGKQGEYFTIIYRKQDYPSVEAAMTEWEQSQPSDSTAVSR